MNNNKKNKVGRPEIKLNSRQKKQVEELASYLTIKQIAEHLDISPAKFYNLKNEDVEIARAYKKGFSQKIVKFAKLLEDKADGTNANIDTAATIFFLKAKAGWSTEQSKKLKADIPTDATPLDIVNKAITEIREGSLTLSEVKQLTDLAQVKQQLLTSPVPEQQEYKKYTPEQWLEMSETILAASDVLEKAFYKTDKEEV